MATLHCISLLCLYIPCNEDISVRNIYFNPCTTTVPILIGSRYMAKYASKGEPRSQPVSSIFKSCVDRLNNTSHAHTALCSAMIRSIAERDFSAQETAHQLLSLPLFSCTFNFIALSLNGGTTDTHSGEQKIEKSLLHAQVCPTLTS
jgi:hypothetical protein